MAYGVNLSENYYSLFDMKSFLVFFPNTKKRRGRLNKFFKVLSLFKCCIKEMRVWESREPKFAFAKKNSRNLRHTPQLYANRIFFLLGDNKDANFDNDERAGIKSDDTTSGSTEGIETLACGEPKAQVAR